MPYLFGDDYSISDITTNPGTQCHMRFLIKGFNTMLGRWKAKYLMWMGIKDITL